MDCWSLTSLGFLNMDYITCNPCSIITCYYINLRKGENGSDIEEINTGTKVSIGLTVNNVLCVLEAI